MLSKKQSNFKLKFYVLDKLDQLALTQGLTKTEVLENLVLEAADSNDKPLPKKKPAKVTPPDNGAAILLGQDKACAHPAQARTNGKDWKCNLCGYQNEG